MVVFNGVGGGGDKNIKKEESKTWDGEDTRTNISIVKQNHKSSYLQLIIVIILHTL